MFEKYLQEIGLSEKEAQVYLALLQVDNESIQDLAKRSGINRTTVYPVLETLENKGLVSEVQVGKKVHYEAAPPERLETFVERQKVVLQERSERLKDVIPQIKSVQREEGERPVIKFFEGRDGAISAYEEFYSFDDSISKDGYFILNSDLLSQVFTEKEFEKFRKIRQGKNINATVIYNRQNGPKEFENTENQKHIPSEYLITTDIAVVDDKVIISTLGETISSMLIKSKDIADTLRSLIRYTIEK
jgi:sugar-specific transcriptional regulator TrmB